MLGLVPVSIGALTALYLLYSWLLGSYTVLRWPWLRLRLVFQRLFMAAAGTLLTWVVLSWMMNLGPSHPAWLSQSVVLEFLLLQTGWSLVVRLGLRGLSRIGTRPSWELMAAPAAQLEVVRQWQRNPFVRPPRPLSTERLPHRQPSLGVVLASHHRDLDAHQETLLQQLQQQGVTVTTIEDLAERQLERLPPSLLPEDWLTFGELRWMNEFSFQRKLKRTADVFLALLLLGLSMPVLLLSALLIWLEDRGSVFYVQERSGWMGRPFALIKLRTMRAVSPGAAAPWTTRGDQRITRIGGLLRRTRLDELPQLLNVLSGEMSLIGPRPEQVGLEAELERAIPHYRKRHWMPPGLSGWAQVCGPAYAASLEEAELKLSYDLFYLRNFSTWLDLLILAKTIKTVLKARGR